MSEYVLSLSYGKDSLACLGAIEKLGWPLTRIVHAEIWATDTIPADLPPMVEFKAKADEIIKQRWGIKVEHVCATDKDGTKLTYEKIFYRVPKRRAGGSFDNQSFAGFPYTTGAWCNDRLKTRALDNIATTFAPPPNPIYGFPMRKGNWCTSDLKRKAIKHTFSNGPSPSGGDKSTVVQYIGIAEDEPERLARLDGTTKVSPLAAVGWAEAECRQWCEENDLLSPIYTTATRGGCWFCHNQGIDQLRQLRHNYPGLWALLMKWDLDSPVTFHSDGHTVHDFDLRFFGEDLGIFPQDRKFRWAMLQDPTISRKYAVFSARRKILNILEA